MAELARRGSSRLSSTADASSDRRGGDHAEVTPVDEPTLQAMRCATARRPSSGDGRRRLADPSPATTCGSGSRTDGVGDAGRRCRATRSAATYFCFLSAHRLDAVALRRRARTTPPSRRPSASTEIVQGVTGGDTRFQVFARVHSPTDARRRHAQGRRPRRRPARSDRGCRSTPAPTGTSARPGRCSASTSSATPTCATSTCPATSRATRCARTSRCSPAW